MGQGAPAVITNPFYQGYDSNPQQDAEAAVFRAKQIVQQRPVYQPSYQFSVPPAMYNRGWVAPDVPPVAGPTYPAAVQAPEVHYINKAYAGLVQYSAQPVATVNRSGHVLSAPPIATTY